MKISGVSKASVLLLVALIASCNLVEAENSSPLYGGLDEGTDPCEEENGHRSSIVPIKVAQAPRPVVFASESAINRAAVARAATVRAVNVLAADERDGYVTFGGVPGGIGVSRGAPYAIDGGDGPQGFGGPSGNEYPSEDDSGLSAQDLLSLDPRTPIVPKFRAIGDLCHGVPMSKGATVRTTTTVLPAYPGKLKDFYNGPIFRPGTSIDYSADRPFGNTNRPVGDGGDVTVFFDDAGRPIDGRRVPIGGRRVPIGGRRVPIDGAGRPIGGRRVPIAGAGRPIGGRRVFFTGVGRPIDGFGVSLDDAGRPINGHRLPFVSFADDAGRPINGHRLPFVSFADDAGRPINGHRLPFVSFADDAGRPINGHRLPFVSFADDAGQPIDGRRVFFTGDGRPIGGHRLPFADAGRPIDGVGVYFDDAGQPIDGRRVFFDDAGRPIDGPRVTFADAGQPKDGRRVFFVDAGRPIGGHRLPFAHAGRPIGGHRVTFADTGRPIGGHRLPFAHAGRPIGGIGVSFADAGQPISGIDVPFDNAGQPVGGIGVPFDNAGQPVGGIGVPFDNAGQPIGGIGVPFVSGDGPLPNSGVNVHNGNFGFDNEFDIGEDVNLSFDEQEKIYNGQNKVPSMPADPVSVTLAYKNLLKPHFNSPKKLTIPEERLSFGPQKTPVDGRIRKAPTPDIPEEKLQIVDKPIVELKPMSLSLGKDDNDNEPAQNGQGPSGTYISYSDLGYAPIEPNGNRFVNSPPVPTAYASTQGPTGESPSYDEPACGPLGPPLPGYRPGSVIVRVNDGDDDGHGSHQDRENNFGEEKDDSNSIDSYRDDGSSDENDGEYGRNDHSESGSNKSSFSPFLSRLWQKVNNRRTGTGCLHL